MTKVRGTALWFGPCLCIHMFIENQILFSSKIAHSFGLNVKEHREEALKVHSCQHHPHFAHSPLPEMLIFNSSHYFLIFSGLYVHIAR